MSLIVNEKRLPATIKRLFKNSVYEIITELLQNAQRAGATEIHFNSDRNARTITVRDDDGAGIAADNDAWERVLRMADSFYSNSAVEENQNPVGVGLVSLFALEQVIDVSISSRGKTATIETSKLWNSEHYWANWTDLITDAPYFVEGFEITIKCDESETANSYQQFAYKLEYALTKAGDGGGIRNDKGGKLLISASTIRGNVTAGDGGGVFSFGDGSQVNVVNSTINNNSASSGGGIYNFSTLSLINSTVSGNTTVLFGGGIFNDGLNGATAVLTSSTVSYNRAGDYGGGIGNSSGTFNIRNTIVSGNNSGSGTAPDFSGTLTSQGYNLIENTGGTTITGTTAGNILGQNPLLDPVLGNNGGSILTHALLAGSPAINAGDNTNATATDQRGSARINGGIIDIGAYEFISAKSRKRVRFF